MTDTTSFGEDLSLAHELAAAASEFTLRSFKQGVSVNLKPDGTEVTPRYETSDYLGLLATFSDHRLLPAEQFEQPLDAVPEAIECFGGGIEVHYEANLYVSRRVG